MHAALLRPFAALVLASLPITSTLRALHPTGPSVVTRPQPTNEARQQGPADSALWNYLERLAGVGFSGAATVEEDGELLLEAAFGNACRDPLRAMTTSTVFPLGSISKHFTAALVLRLEMDGVLSTEDALSRWIDIPAEQVEKRAITLHHLLSHTSGLGESGGLATDVDGESFAKRILRTELIFPPGTDVSYSNEGYGLLALVVEKATGEDLATALRRYLFDPAGMRDTGFAREHWREADLPHGYIDDRDTGTLVASMGGSIPVWLQGAGGLQSTLADMRRWSRALRTNAVLDEGAFAKMITPRVDDGGGFAMGYGCGIVTSALGKRIEHTGSNDIFSAYFQHYLDRDLCVFAATNDADMYAEGPMRGLERILNGDGIPAAPRTIAMEPQELARYAGTWRDEAGETLEIAVRRGGLTLSSSDPGPAALLHPVRPHQIARRGELIAAVEASFPKAYAGDFEPLRRLLAPYVPLEDFAQGEGRLLDRLVEQNGPFQSVRAVPGRNRFGEVAVIAELAFEADVARIEYSFGEGEVGSIRFLPSYPVRVVHPTAPASFVAYDPVEDRSFEVGFVLGDEGDPQALVLFDEAGEPHALERVD